MLAGLLLLAALQASDPVRVQARLDDEEIRVGETTVLRVDVETDGPRASIRQFRSLPPGVELRGTRDSDQRQFSIPGGTSRFISREFVLSARTPGRYRLPAVEVVVDGDVYATRSTILTVRGSGVTRGGEVPGAAGEGVVLRTWVDSDTVYVGEQVTLESEAMFSQDARLRLRRAPEYEPPSPSGFWIHDLPEDRRATTRIVGGEAYEVQRFRRVLFPLAPGEYEIPPARLEYEIRRGLLYSPQTRQLASDPVRLVVLSTPEPEPAAFTGAVGSYSLRGRLEPVRVPAGEATVLTVEVTGAGNVKALPPPELPEMDGIEVFPPSEEAEVDSRGERIRGTKRFSWVLIPREPGEIELPPIDYAYFDPDAGAYQTVSVGPLELSVTPGIAADDEAPAATLRYIRTSPAPADPLGWVRTSWFAAAQAVPLLLLAFGFGWTRRRARGHRPLSNRALRRQRTARLRELEDQAVHDDRPIFGDAEAFARQWLADRLELPSRRDASDPAALRAAGVSDATATGVSTLIDRLSAARYAPDPPGPEATRDMVRALRRLLDRVDREASGRGGAPWWRAGARARRGGAALTVVLLGLGGSAADAAAGQSSFEEGVRAFDEQRYRAAAEAFDQHLARNPGDAAAWYNLGTAYYRAGHPGYGVWAWLKVPPLAPRNRDVRHNLRVAGVAPEVVDRVAPPLPLRSSELLLGASLAWLLAGVAGALWLLRRGRRAAVAALLGLVLAIALGAAGWAADRHPPTRIVLEGSVLRAGPTLRGQPVAELEPGTALEPVEVRGDWIRARTLRGDDGWVERAATAAL